MSSQAPAKANDKQVAGTHYQDQVGSCPHCRKPIQHWDLYAKLPYLIGCATKYITRCILKNGKEDLQKAKHYLEKLIEVYYPELPFQEFPWQYAGGPNECEHGYAAGIPCRDCWLEGKGTNGWQPPAERTERPPVSQAPTPEAEPVQAAVPLAVQQPGAFVLAKVPDLDAYAAEAAQARAEHDVRARAGVTAARVDHSTLHDSAEHSL